jgi:glycosyltransferase involved in cell wall biosynthesis
MKRESLSIGLQGWPRTPFDQAAYASRTTWPRVSLVTPSFNQARFLEQTILSVVNQGYPSLEYFVMDGGSTDGSVEVIERHASRLSFWESTADRGQAHAINKGWRRATGDYVWWLNADDMLTPGSLCTSVTFLENNPGVDMAYGDVFRIDGQGRLMDRFNYHDFDFAPMVLHGLSISQAGALARRRVIEKVGELDEGLHYLMDQDFWTRLALAQGRIVHIREPLALFRIHEEAKTQLASIHVVEESRRLHRALMAHPDLPPEIDQGRRRVTSNMHLYCARALVKVGRYREALGEGWSSLRAWPPQLLQEGLWRHLVLSILGLAIGERAWVRLRAWARRLRRPSPDEVHLG